MLPGTLIPMLSRKFSVLRRVTGVAHQRSSTIGTILSFPSGAGIGDIAFYYSTRMSTISLSAGWTLVAESGDAKIFYKILASGDLSSPIDEKISSGVNSYRGVITISLGSYAFTGISDASALAETSTVSLSRTIPANNTFGFKVAASASLFPGAGLSLEGGKLYTPGFAGTDEGFALRDNNPNGDVAATAAMGPQSSANAVFLFSFNVEVDQ